MNVVIQPGCRSCICHESSAAIDECAVWYRANYEKCPKPTVPFLQQMFGLTAPEVYQALSEVGK